MINIHQFNDSEFNKLNDHKKKPKPAPDWTVRTEWETTLVQYYIYFLQWILVAIQEIWRIMGAGEKKEWNYRNKNSPFFKFNFN